MAKLIQALSQMFIENALKRIITVVPALLV
jgi:hypothetical protein